jgi:hypothetical protein
LEIVRVPAVEPSPPLSLSLSSFSKISLESNYFRLTRILFVLYLDALDGTVNKIEGDVD